jgi:hypothetical protein
MGDSPAPDAGAGGTPPSGDSVPVTPPQGAPMSPESVTAVGSHATGRAKMGVALLLINQAMKDFSPGSEDHMHALEMFQKGVKHFKQQEPLTPSAPQMQRPSMPGMPGAGGPPGMGGPPGGMPSLPQPPRGPIPAPMGAM